MTATILLADDHRMVAEGLKTLLEPEYELVAIVEDGAALVAAAEEWEPDVIVADISMPLLNGFEAARRIKERNERAKIIFLTMHPEVGYAVGAFDSGASGYVLKQSAPCELVTAINEVLAGRTYVTPVIAGALMQAYREMSAHGNKHPSPSPRQREVLQLLSEGRSIKEIASVMSISRRTVEFHKYRVMDVLGITNTTDLIRYAIKHGIVST